MRPRTTRPATSPPSARRPSGLSAPTAVFLLLVATFVAAVVTARTGSSAGQIINVTFAVVTVYVALRVRVHEWFTALVAPPLVYVSALFLAALLNVESTTRSVRRDVEDTLINLTLGAPWFVGAMVIAALVLLVRTRRATRSPRR